MLRLMVITDGLRGDPRELVDRIAAAVSGGVTCVQVRLKEVPARVVVDVTREIIARLASEPRPEYPQWRGARPGVPVLVNDRLDIALAAGAAGVHLGADDVPVDEARRVTPPGFIIGASVGCDAEIANAALADYVGIGPVYSTGTKKDAGDAIGIAEFARLASATGKPAIGVGGITARTARAVLDAGGVGVAVVSAICASPDPAAAAMALCRAIGT